MFARGADDGELERGAVFEGSVLDPVGAAVRAAARVNEPRAHGEDDPVPWTAFPADRVVFRDGSARSRSSELVGDGGRAVTSPIRLESAWAVSHPVERIGSGTFFILRAAR